MEENHDGFKLVFKTSIKILVYHKLLSWVLYLSALKNVDYDLCRL